MTFNISAELDNVVKSCRYLLNNCPEAEAHLEYLNSRLNYSSQEAFSFGYFPTVKNIKLITSLIEEKVLKKLNLLFQYSLEDATSSRIVSSCFFEHHSLILPYRDVYGNIIALVGRSLLGDDDRRPLNIAKYKNTIFKKANHLFGLFEAKKAILQQNCVYIVEGQFDVIKAHERGIYNIVAVGNSTISDYQMSVINRYTDNVYILFDNDEAGQKGRDRAIEKFKNKVNINNFYIPSPYKDIDECLKNNDINDLSLILETKYS